MGGRGPAVQYLMVLWAFRMCDAVRVVHCACACFKRQHTVLGKVPAPFCHCPPLPAAQVTLMQSYVNRMESTVTQWYSNIMVVDLKVGLPRAGVRACRLQAHGQPGAPWVLPDSSFTRDALQVLRGWAPAKTCSTLLKLRLHSPSV